MDGKADMNPRPPLTIRMHADDNVAIVANDGGLPAGTVLPAGVPGAGVALLEKIPQGHKVALVDIARDAVVRRYGVPIGYALRDLPAGSWVHERVLRIPAARALEGLPMATVRPPAAAPLTGYTFEGFRNADGSVGTRNILAITTTVQCVAGVVAQAVARIKARAAARVPVRGRRDRPRAHLRLRSRHRRARRGDSHPHAAQHLAQPELRRRAAGGEPGLREAAARPAAAAGLVPDRRRTRREPGPRDDLPAGGTPRRLPVDAGRHRGERQAAPRAPERAPARNHSGQRTGGRRAVRRQRRLLGIHRQSGGGVRGRPAGARRRHRDVQREHRSARRRGTAHQPGRLGRGRGGHRARTGLVRPLPGARPGRSLRQHHAGQQGRGTGQHRREGDGLDREERHGADRARAAARAKSSSPGSADWCSPPRRRATSSAARCNWPPA